MLAGKSGPKVQNIEALLRGPDETANLPIYNAAGLMLYGIALGENSVKLDPDLWINKGDGTCAGKAGTQADGCDIEINTASVHVTFDHTYFSNQSPEDAPFTQSMVDGFAVEYVDADGDSANSQFMSATFALDPKADQPAMLFSAKKHEKGADTAAPGSTGSEAGAEGQAIIGTDASETLKGTNGDDFINGMGGEDVIFAGEGNDLIVLDNNDVLIDGGAGLDIILAGDTALTLDAMLANFDNRGTGAYNEKMPMVHDVEIMIKGIDVTGLTSMDELASKYGIHIGKDSNGNNTLSLDKGWVKDGETNNFTNADNGLSIETSNMTDITDSANTETIILQMQVQSEAGGN